MDEMGRSQGTKETPAIENDGSDNDAATVQTGPPSPKKRK